VWADQRIQGKGIVTTCWLGCPDDLKRPLSVYAAAVANVLADGLAGIYVHGSVARGCYSAATSDADLIVVMKTPCADPAAGEVAALHIESGISLDAAFVTQSQLRCHRVPTPIEFLVKSSGPSSPRLWHGSSGYFLLDRQDAYECSISLAGVPFRDLAPPAPWPVRSRVLADLLPHILPKFKNPALMLSRIAYAFVHREFCSKREAGRWALTALDDRWRPVIEQALARYTQGLRDDAGPTDELRALEQQCRDIIAQTGGGGM
jgi:streptomycin 3"-adenylyltransferase